MSNKEQWIGPVILAAISVGLLVVISIVVPLVASAPPDKTDVVGTTEEPAIEMPADQAREEYMDSPVAPSSATPSSVVLGPPTYLCFPMNQTALNEEMESEQLKVSEFVDLWSYSARVVVRASTSDLGDQAANRQIRERRAAAVKQLLIESGISESLVDTRTVSVALPCAECAKVCKDCREGQCVSLTLEK
ncbi:MAG: OmpA family protein [Myxococcales bacterium]|nr:OmpA family protein [Myxococcales bacterium]